MDSFAVHAVFPQACDFHVLPHVSIHLLMLSAQCVLSKTASDTPTQSVDMKAHSISHQQYAAYLIIQLCLHQTWTLFIKSLFA